MAITPNQLNNHIELSDKNLAEKIAISLYAIRAYRRKALDRINLAKLNKSKGAPKKPEMNQYYFYGDGPEFRAVKLPGGKIRYWYPLDKALQWMNNQDPLGIDALIN